MAEVLKHHKARKRFGQNFLNDDFWINKIAEAVDPKEGQKIIEIGPGQAALTKELIAGAKHIYCVEIDRDLAAWLRTKFTPEQLTVLEADALKFDWRDFAAEEKIRVVGNLPYNISSPLLFKLSEISDRVVGISISCFRKRSWTEWLPPRDQRPTDGFRSCFKENTAW